METEILIRFDSDSCEMTDITALRNLMLDNGYRVREQTETNSGEMGVGATCLALLIPILPDVIKAIADLLERWSIHRRVELEFTDSATGVTMKVTADKNATSRLFEQCLVHISKATERNAEAMTQ